MLDMSCSVYWTSDLCTSPAAQCYDTTHTCDEAHLWRDNGSVPSCGGEPVVAARNWCQETHVVTPLASGPTPDPAPGTLCGHTSHCRGYTEMSPTFSWTLGQLTAKRVGCSFIILLSKIFFSGAIRRRDFWWSILTNIFDQQNLNELVFFVCILYLDNENLLFAIFPYQ